MVFFVLKLTTVKKYIANVYSKLQNEHSQKVIFEHTVANVLREKLLLNPDNFLCNYPDMKNKYRLDG